jgi:hypothetical protein
VLLRLESPWLAELRAPWPGTGAWRFCRWWFACSSAAGQVNPLVAFANLVSCGPSMVSSQGFEELLPKEPLTYLVEDATALVSLLDSVKNCRFADGHQELRWRRSHFGTWEARAEAMVHTLP